MARVLLASSNECTQRRLAPRGTAAEAAGGCGEGGWRWGGWAGIHLAESWARTQDGAKLFKNRGFKPAKGQDDISGTFVINSLYIWDHALCHSDIHRALICGAERFSHNSMFDSVHKIADVIRKCKMDSTKVKWTFMMMLDRVQEGYHWFKTQCMCISFLAQ